MSEQRKENKMGVMPVKQLIISMSLPMMISMLVQALYNVVDSIFVAKISENALTAVTLAFPMQNLMIALASGTGVGINSLLSRSLGEKKYDRADDAANTGILLTIMSFVVFLIIGIFGSRAFIASQTSDAAIIGAFVDGSILVIEAGNVDYRLIQKIRDKLITSGSRILGVVLNKVDKSNKSYGYYKRGYGYGYGQNEH